MNSAKVSEGLIFDAIIVVCSHQKQLKLWEPIVRESLVPFLRDDGQIILLKEEWNGSAGNGLGTLNALSYLKQSLGFDLKDFESWLRDKKIGIYHTAGKGTRIAPLSLAEGSNKGGILLPHGKKGAITLLEAVVRQTAPYCQKTKQSIYVFWSDQLFFSDLNDVTFIEQEVSIYTIPVEIENQEDWDRQNLDHYGIFVETELKLELLEKSSFDQLEKIRSKNQKVNVYKSLGCFSLSSTMTCRLLHNFESMLDVKNECIDSDPHLWQPLLFYLSKQKWPSSINQQLKSQLLLLDIKEGDIGLVKLPLDTQWIDFGRLNLYFDFLTHLEKFSKLSPFLNLPDPDSKGNICIKSKIQDSAIKNSLICQSNCSDSQIEGSVLINCTIDSSDLKKVLSYRCGILNQTIENSCYVSHLDNDEPFVFKSPLEVDRKMWFSLLEGNLLSFQEGYNKLVDDSLPSSPAIHILCDYSA